MAVTACMQKENEEGKLRAISANESVKEKWQRSRKSVELEVTAKGEQMPMRIGVFAESNEATEEESESINGIPFIRSKEGNTYRPENSAIYTGDTAAIFRISWPYTAKLKLCDTINLDAPFDAWLYGIETSREITDEKMKIKIGLQHSTSMVRLRLESADMRKILSETSLSGSNIYTAGDYVPYTGKWLNLRGAGNPISLTMDKRMSRYQYIDFVIPPSPHAGDVKIAIKADGEQYIVKTTLPRLGRGEMTQLNMELADDGLRIKSSWIEGERGVETEQAACTDSIAEGDYLLSDGSTSRVYGKDAVAVVIESDGRHGKAVALKDMDGLICFGKEKYSSGILFTSVDKQKTEGYINPTRATSIDELQRIVYTPTMAYPTDCALGYTDGCLLSQKLQSQKKEWDKDELGAYINKTDAAYVPSLGELAKLYYILNPYKGETFSPEGFSRPSGVYTSISESTEGRNYIMDFDTGLASGNVSKKTRLRLRMFYLF